MTEEDGNKLSNLLYKGFVITVDGFAGTNTIKEFQLYNNILFAICETGDFFPINKIQVEKIRVYKEVTDWRNE